MNLIDEQREAVHFGSRSSAIAIHAGAGAGKTGVLVERYLHCVRDLGESPAEILTITFTRKAAAEMKRRIVHRLRDAGLVEQARQAQVGPISTIHGYCERLLREYPFDAGLDPKFDILAPNQTREIIDRCSSAVLADKDSMSSAERSLLAMRGLQSYSDNRHSINEWIYRTIDRFRTAGRSPSDLEHLAESSQHVTDLWTICLESWARDTNAHLEPGWLVDGVKSGGDPWMRIKSSEQVESQAAVATQGLASFAARAWRLLLDEFEKARALDFSELEGRALRLLQERPEVVQGKYLRMLVDEAQDLNPVQYDLIRATPVSQMLLVGDPQQSIYGFRGARRELFMEYLDAAEHRSLVVNWRSTSLILRHIDKVFTRIWTDDYQRMRPAHTAAASDDPFDEGIEGAPIEIWKTNRVETGVAEGVSRLIHDEGVDPSGITVLLRGANNLEWIVRGLRSKDIDPVILGVGGKYFQRNEVRDLGSALSAVADPLDDLALVSLMRSPLVGVSLDGCFRSVQTAREAGVPVIDQLQRDAPLDDEDLSRLAEMLRWLLPLADIAGQVPAWEILSRIMAGTQSDLRFALADNAAQLIANSRKLLSIAMENREMSAREFGAWISDRHSLRLASESTLSDAEYDLEAKGRPAISTMHSAKGLEWDTVIVDATQDRWKRMKGDLEIEAFSGMLAVALREPGVLEKQTSRPRAHAAIAHRSQQSEIAETKRLLYVAMTRAKKRLVVVVDAAKRGECAPDILTALAPNWQGSNEVVVRDFTQAALQQPAGEAPA